MEPERESEATKKDDKFVSKLVIIDKLGDVVLNVVDKEGQALSRYRVSSEMLQKHSRYFKALLAANRFSEGAILQSRLQSLTIATNGNFQDLAVADLPNVQFPEIDQLLFSEVTFQALEVLLTAIHGTSLGNRKTDVNLLAHITVLAEQIIASECISSFMKRYLEGLKLAAKQVTEPKRERWRQLVYLGYIFDDWRSFAHYTALLINWGPSSEQDSGQVDDKSPASRAARISTPWQILPADIEDELSVRRHYILRTIASIPQSLLRPYLFNPRVIPNCKLGYGDSSACDSFQLGEGLRFLVRKGLLSSNLKLCFDPDYAQGDLYVGQLSLLLESIKEMPNYQLNNHHRHCGIRGLLVNRLNGIEAFLGSKWHSGLCLICLKGQVPYVNWAHNPRGGIWRGGIMEHKLNKAISRKSDPALQTSGEEGDWCFHTQWHLFYAKIFTADEWDWIDKPQ